MPNYLLLLHEDPAAFEQVSPEEMQAIIQKYTDWKSRMETAGVLTRGEKLQDRTGRVLRRTSDRTSITDGPYTESKRFGGLFEIQVLMEIWARSRSVRRNKLACLLSLTI